MPNVFCYDSAHGWSDPIREAREDVLGLRNALEPFLLRLCEALGKILSCPVLVAADLNCFWVAKKDLS